MYVNGQPLRANRDGMEMPLSLYFSIIDGHQFEILRGTAMRTAPRYVVGDAWGLPVYDGTNWKDARLAAIHEES